MGHRLARAGALTALFAVAAASWPRSARAELFTFTDDGGVIHFTNLPDDPRYRPLRAEGSSNTFAWQDDLGSSRTLHRVDVDDYDDLIIEAARYYALPPALVKAVIGVESAFEPHAISPAGAVGLMQLIAETAAEMFVADAFEPRANVFGGTRYLRVLANRFGGDLRRTVAAYNAGPRAVERVKDVPPISETRRYVQRVLALYEHYLATWTKESP